MGIEQTRRLNSAAVLRVIGRALCFSLCFFSLPIIPDLGVASATGYRATATAAGYAHPSEQHSAPAHASIKTPIPIPLSAPIDTAAHFSS